MTSTKVGPTVPAAARLKIALLERAIFESERFVAAARVAIRELNDPESPAAKYGGPSRRVAAARRASMDAASSLAAFRRGRTV